MVIARRLLVAATAMLGMTPSAHAQGVEAEVLFREGKRLMTEGKIAAACDKYDASNRLETSVGTLLNLADCREKNKQLATAWAVFRKAATTAKQAGNDGNREAEARRRATALEARYASLTIVVPEASRVDGLVIKRDTVVLDPALWGSAIPIDPGDYKFVGQAPKYEVWSAVVHVTAEKEKVKVEIPKFKLIGAKPAVEPKPVVTAQRPAPKPVVTARPTITANEISEDEAPDVEERPSRFTPLRKISLVVAAVGVLGVVAGVVLGSKAADLATQSDALCPTTECMNERGVALNRDARSNGLYANLGFVVGGAAIAGAGALWFVGAPKTPADEVSIVPVVDRGELGFSFTGRF